MRQVVLVVVLVGAAFLGGAFVNGPGLRWVQTQVLGSLGLGDGGEIASVDLKAAASPDAVLEGRGRSSPVAGHWHRSRGSSRIADRRSRAHRQGVRTARMASTARAIRGRRPRRLRGPGRDRAPALAAARRLLVVAAAEGPREGDGPPPLPVDLAPPASAGTRRDPDVTLATARVRAGRRPPPGDRAPSGRDVPPAADGLAGGPDALTGPGAAGGPDAAPPDRPRRRRPDPQPGSAPARPGDDDWATLARKMQTLGVSRFTIEGQPGGRVVFSCLIPLAGRQAVTQRFEAEGEDAHPGGTRPPLRRVALWRAAQPQSAAPDDPESQEGGYPDGTAFDYNARRSGARSRTGRDRKSRTLRGSSPRGGLGRRTAHGPFDRYDTSPAGPGRHVLARSLGKEGAANGRWDPASRAVDRHR